MHVFDSEQSCSLYTNYLGLSAMVLYEFISFGANIDAFLDRRRMIGCLHTVE